MLSLIRCVCYAQYHTKIDAIVDQAQFPGSSVEGRLVLHALSFRAASSAKGDSWEASTPKLLNCFAVVYQPSHAQAAGETCAEGTSCSALLQCSGILCRGDRRMLQVLHTNIT